MEAHSSNQSSSNSKYQSCEVCGRTCMYFLCCYCNDNPNINQFLDNDNDRVDIFFNKIGYQSFSKKEVGNYLNYCSHCSPEDKTLLLKELKKKSKDRIRLEKAHDKLIKKREKQVYQETILPKVPLPDRNENRFLNWIRNAITSFKNIF